MSGNEYVLITAAYNEGAYIGATIEAVLAQSLRPQKWVIVSDGSTDDTDAVIKQYVKQCRFIEYFRREKAEGAPGFASKVSAIHAGYGALRGTRYRFIGILDADVTFDSDYYERVINQFHKDPELGIAGGFIYETRNGRSVSRSSNSTRSVAGAIQLFRRECYENIGGHRPIDYGGEDWVCEIEARCNGWTVEAFPQVIVQHHKPNVSRRGALREAIRQGRMDYVVGSHPIFEIVKCLRRVSERPYFLSAAVRYASFSWSCVAGYERVISEEGVKALRRDQAGRLKHLVQFPSNKKGDQPD